MISNGENLGSLAAANKCSGASCQEEQSGLQSDHFDVGARLRKRISARYDNNGKAEALKKGLFSATT